MILGAHVPATNPLDEALARGAEVVQLFLSNPQSWKPPLPREDEAALRAASIPVYVHAPYLINPVAENTRVRIPSRRILQETCDAASAIGAAGVVVHGGHVSGEEGGMREAFPRWRKALEQLDTDVPVLIENTAGGDNAVVRRLETTRLLWDEIGDLSPGYVLDTCHAWAGGEPLDELVERTEAVVGRVDLVHLNDSRDPFDSRRDRHANLGSGEIPAERLMEIVAAASAPVIIETPGGADDHRADLAWVRSGVK
ncbi:MAG TPA: deoxyribonuclease IV [Acidimicrobiia bacterium]|nr:deoxyribonuclease IV [Acidimicrobiia bacterium]